MKLLSDRPGRMADLSEVLLFEKDGKTSAGKRRIVGLKGSSHDIIKLEGIDDRSEAEALKGFYLAVPREAAYEPEEGEYFIPDLIGMRVADRERGVIGTLAEVPETPANDILLVKRSGKKDLLIPLAPGILQDVDFAEGVIHVVLPAGLWEIYE